MSDGPHRSLDMRPAWKRAAERLDREAWSRSQSADAMCKAVEADFRRDVPEDLQAAVRTVLGVTSQQPLFADQPARDIQELRRRGDLSSMARAMIDYVEVAIEQGRSGFKAYEEAIQNTCIDRGAEGARQMEEHYKRETHIERARNLRREAEATLQSSQFQSLGRAIANQDVESVRRAVGEKQTGLDAGPEFRR